MWDLQPFSLLVGAVLGVAFVLISDSFIERQARNKRLVEAAREKKQC